MGKAIRQEKVEKQEKVKTTKNTKKEKEMSRKNQKSLKEAINETVSKIEEVETEQTELDSVIEENLSEQLTEEIEEFSNKVFDDLKNNMEILKETGIATTTDESTTENDGLHFKLSEQSIDKINKAVKCISKLSDEKKEKEEPREDLLNLRKAVDETSELINELTKELTQEKPKEKNVNPYKIGLAVIAGGIALGIGGYILYKKLTSGENVELI